MIRKIKRLFTLLVMCLVVAVGYYAYEVYSFTQTIGQSKVIKTREASSEVAAAPKADIPIWGGTERVNILLMGVDSRELRPDELPRSDSMMLVSIDPTTKTYNLFSILRDTYVRIPDHGRARINTALSQGGPELAMQTVSNFTGLTVSNYVVTDFEGFKSLIDAVGGVEIDVEKDMEYRDPTDKGMYDIDLKKGLQHLDGNQSLQYVRFRHDAMSDYTRTERQRKLLLALSDQMKSGMTLIQLPSILESVQPYIQTNLSTVDMVKLAALGFGLKPSAAGGQQLPPMGLFQESSRGGSVLIPDVESVQQFVQEKLNQTTPDPAPATP
nr:LCP family protein [Brevibacillus dissolubilis]